MGGLMSLIVDVSQKCRKPFCRSELPPWSRPPYGNGPALCARHEYVEDYSRRRALNLILRERNVQGDGEPHRLLYLLKAVVLVALFPRRAVGYPIYDTVVATCDFHPYHDDFGGSWHEVAIGWGWRPRSWRWEWRSEGS